MSGQQLRIAVADDEQDMRDYLVDVLPDLGHQVVVCAATGSDLIASCRAQRPDLIITDVRMPDGDGLEAAKQLNTEQFTPVIVLTAFHDSETLQRAMDAQVFAYLVKPIERCHLESAVALAWSRFCQFQNLRREADSLRQALEDRKLVERAKGILMKQAGIDEEQAFRRLQKLARDEQARMSDIARMIITAERAMRLDD